MKTRASWDVGIAPMCEKSDKNCCIEMSELPSLGLSENATVTFSGAYGPFIGGRA